MNAAAEKLVEPESTRKILDKQKLFSSKKGEDENALEKKSFDA